MCSAQCDARSADTDIGYMNALVDSCAKVKDPLSNASLDLTRQCVNVSLSRDGLTEVCSPSLPFTSAHAQALPMVLRCVVVVGEPACPTCPRSWTEASRDRRA